MQHSKFITTWAINNGAAFTPDNPGVTLLQSRQYYNPDADSLACLTESLTLAINALIADQLPIISLDINVTIEDNPPTFSFEIAILTLNL